MATRRPRRCPTTQQTTSNAEELTTRKVVILAAEQPIARLVTGKLAAQGHLLTLFVPDVADLPDAPSGAHVVQGVVTDPDEPDSDIAGAQVVVANLTEPVDQQAAAIVPALLGQGVERLIVLATEGPDEGGPGLFGLRAKHRDRSFAEGCADAAALITSAGPDWTLLAPLRLTDDLRVAHEVSTADPTAEGARVEIEDVADLVVAAVNDPAAHSRQRLSAAG